MPDKRWLVAQSFQPDFVDFLVDMYDKYGEEVFSIHGISNKYCDIANFSKNFFSKSNVADISVDANANVKSKNIVQYDYENNKAITKLNNLYRLYKSIKKTFNTREAQRCIEKLISGELFINDLSNFRPYCYAFDLRELEANGMNFYSEFTIKRPKTAQTFINLMIQTTAFLSNQLAGAVSYPSFFPTFDKYLRNDFGENYIQKWDTNQKTIENMFQNFIYSMNYNFRGPQSAFTNLSILDRGFLKSLFDGYTFYDGSEPNLDSSYELSKRFYEYFNRVYLKENPFTFPVLTLACSLDEETNEYLDPEFVDWVAKEASGLAIGNIFQDIPTSFSSCCRLKNDFKQLEQNGVQNSFGVGGLSIGSIRVAGLNLPRLALLEKDNPDILEENLECLRKIHHAFRLIIDKQIEGGYLPLYTSNWIHTQKQYSTIGIVGAFENVKNHGFDIRDKEGQEKLLNVLNTIEEKIKSWQDMYRKQGKIYTFNVECIPGESFMIRCSELDRLLGYNKDNVKLYSNQYLPLIEDASIYDRIKLQGIFDSKTSGGAILHLNVDDEKPVSPEQFKKLMDVNRQMKSKYFAINYCYSQDSEGNLIIGKHETNPTNGLPIVQQLTRVVGFITPIKAWNKVRREYEFPRRVFYTNEQVENCDNKEVIEIEELIEAVA